MLALGNLGLVSRRSSPEQAQVRWLRACWKAISGACVQAKFAQPAVPEDERASAEKTNAEFFSGRLSANQVLARLDLETGVRRSAVFQKQR